VLKQPLSDSSGYAPLSQQRGKRLPQIVEFQTGEFRVRSYPVSRIGLNPGSHDRVKTSQCCLSFRTGSAAAMQVNSGWWSHPIRDGRRPGSLGSAAVREWALPKLVGAWPPQAERTRPVGWYPHDHFASLSGSSFVGSLGLSASLVALSFRR
jgi:hypothetical protein